MPSAYFYLQNKCHYFEIVYILVSVCNLLVVSSVCFQLWRQANHEFSHCKLQNSSFQGDTRPNNNKKKYSYSPRNISSFFLFWKFTRSFYSIGFSKITITIPVNVGRNRKKKHFKSFWKGSSHTHTHKNYSQNRKGNKTLFTTQILSLKN